MSMKSSSKRSSANVFIIVVLFLLSTFMSVIQTSDPAYPESVTSQNIGDQITIEDQLNPNEENRSHLPRQIPGYDYYGINASLSTFPWWNNSWNYRIAAVQKSTDFLRTEMVTWVRVNFTNALSRLDDSSDLDEDSIRVIEYTQSGTIIGEKPSQLKKERIYDSSTSAEVDVVWMLDGSTTAGQERFYFIYFDGVDNGPKPVPSYPAGNTSATEGQFDGDGDVDEFTLDNTEITLYRSQTSSDRILTSSTGVNGYLYHKGIGSKMATGFRFEERVLKGAEATTIVEHDYPSIITMIEQGPLFSEVKVEVQVTPTDYPGNMYEVYRIYENQSFVELNLWLEEHEDYTISLDWQDRRAYYNTVFDRQYTDMYGDQPFSYGWNPSKQYLAIYNSATLDSLGLYSFTPGNIRATASFIYDSYFDSSVDFEYNFLWAAGPFNEVNDTFGHFKTGVSLGIPEDKYLTISLPQEKWLFTAEEPIPVAVAAPDTISGVSATIYKKGGASISTSLIPSLGDKLFENRSTYIVTSTDPEGIWNVTVQASTIYGTVTKVLKFEVAIFEHRKIFVNDTIVEELQTKSTTSHKFMWESIKDYADMVLLYSPPPIIDPYADLRGHENLITLLAFTYLITEDVSYCTKAAEWMVQISNYPTWDTRLVDLTISHFITGLSIGYDWCYDSLTPIQRHIIRERVLEETERAAREYGPRGGVSILNYYLGNHGEIDNAAIGIAGYTFDGERYRGKKLDTAPFKEMAAEYYSYVYDMLFEDGSTHEGAAYWSYGLEYIIKFTELVRFFGDGNNFNAPYLVNTSIFRLYFTMPDESQIINYCDAPYRGYLRGRPSLFRLASENNDGIAQWLALNEKTYPALYSPYDLLWYDPSIKETSPEEAGYPLWHYFPVWGVVVVRTSWDEDSQLFAFKSSKIIGGHDHPDQNSFLLYANREHLAVDLGYTIIKETENHNTILVDNQGQIGNGSDWMPMFMDLNSKYRGRMLDFFATNHSVFMLGDAHHTYPSALTLDKFDRDIVFVNQEYYVIHDDLESGVDRRYDWLFHTYGTFSKNGNVNWITEGESLLGLELFEPDEAVESVETTLYYPTTKPNGEPNYGGEEVANGYFLRVRPKSKVGSTQFMALLFPTTEKANYPSVTEIGSDGTNGLEIIPATGGRKDIILFNPEQDQSSHAGYKFTGRALVVTEDPIGKITAMTLQNGTSVGNTTHTLVSSTGPMDMAIKYNTSWTEISLQTMPMDEIGNQISLNIHFDGLTQVQVDGELLDDPSYSYNNLTGQLTLSIGSGLHDIMLYRNNLGIEREDIVLSSRNVYYGDDLKIDVDFNYYGFGDSNVIARLYLDEESDHRLLAKHDFDLSGNGRTRFQHTLDTVGLLGDHEIIVNISVNGTEWVDHDNIASHNFSVRGWDFRIPLTRIDGDSITGLQQPCTLDVDLTDALSSLGSKDRVPVDIESLRLIQVDRATGSMVEHGPSVASGITGYRRYEIPFNFNPSAGFDPSTSAKGQITFYINGSDGVSQKDYYLYFDTLRDRITVPGPGLQEEAMEYFQMYFDLGESGTKIPGWVYVKDGSITFNMMGNNPDDTYFITLTHTDPMVTEQRSFNGGSLQKIRFNDMPDGLWEMVIEISGDSDTIFVLGSDSPILFDRDKGLASNLLSEPSYGPAVLYFYVPHDITSFQASEYHYDSDDGSARFTMRDASGTIMDDNLIPQGQERTLPYPRPINVPEISSGQIWSLTVDLDTLFNSWDDFHVTFSGIPSRFAPSADKVFLVDFQKPEQTKAEGYQVEIMDNERFTGFLPGDVINISATTDITDNPFDADAVWVDIIDPLGEIMVKDMPLAEESPLHWDETELYTFDVNDTTGNWSIIVTAISDDGLPTSDIRNIVFNGPSQPFVNITSPGNGSEARGMINITAEALPGDPRLSISEVSIIVAHQNGTLTLYDNDGQAPWSFEWNTTLLPNWTLVNLTAIVVNNLGTQAKSDNVTVIVNNTIPPTPPPDLVINITLLEPENGTMVNGTVDLVVQIGGNTMPSHAEFYIDDQFHCTVDALSNMINMSLPINLTCPWNTTKIKDGQYTINATVFALETNLSAFSEKYSVTVRNAEEIIELISISLVPKKVDLLVNEAQQFNVTAFEHFKKPIADKLLVIEWSVEGNIGIIDENGLFLATTPGNGKVLVSVSLGNTTLEETANITVKTIEESPPKPREDNTWIYAVIAGIVVLIVITILLILFIIIRKKDSEVAPESTTELPQPEEPHEVPLEEPEKEIADEEVTDESLPEKEIVDEEVTDESQHEKEIADEEITDESQPSTEKSDESL